MKLKLYMESTVPSYFVGWTSRDLVTAANQEVTQEWWRKRLAQFEVFISDVVLEEISAGDSAMARKRLDAVAAFSLLKPNDLSEKIALELIRSGIVPQKVARDAAHIALAAAHGMDFLLTWNCRHIANATILRDVELKCAQHGARCPVVCTPLTLMGENYEDPEPLA